MKHYKLVYTSQEDCNCAHSHHTVIVEEYENLQEALNTFYHLDDYEAHSHSVTKSVSLQIEEGDLTKEYSLETQNWNYDTKEWGDVEKFEFDINQPDFEY